MHQKSVCQSWDRPHRRKRRDEPWETYTERLRAMWLAEKAREAEEEAVRQALRREHRRGEPYLEYDEMAPPLPDLASVKGWSKADPEKVPHHPERALFGGWRIGDWEKREKREREKRSRR